MSFKYAKLAGKIKEHFGTQAKFAEAMGMSERGLSLKLNNRTEWKQREIVQACELLSIDVNDISKYFFDEKVQKVEQVG